jgi:hypothetical protein
LPRVLTLPEAERCVTHVSGLDPEMVGGPGRIRTYDQRIMSPLL